MAVYELDKRDGEWGVAILDVWGLIHVEAVRDKEGRCFLLLKHISGPTQRTEYDDPIECIQAFRNEAQKQTGYLLSPHLWAHQSVNPRPLREGE